MGISPGSDVDLHELSPAERAEELLRRLGKLPPKPESNGHGYLEDIPDPGDSTRSAEEQEIDQVIERIDIREAYMRLIGKMIPASTQNRVEGIMISCPLPGHPDLDPSAWLNTETKLWFCGGCQVGGDIYDLAAIHFGYDLATYKSKENFPKLRKQLAECYGFTFTKGITGKVYVTPPSDVPVLPPSTEIPEPAETTELEIPSEALAPVVQLLPTSSPSGANVDSAKIDWEALLPENTFLRLWMEACTINHLPHEYYFWIGLQALGFAAGRNIWLRDNPNVRPNLFVCLYGPTGVGKSTSLHPYLDLLRSVLKFTGDDDKYTDPKGVKLIPMPGSAEALLDSFVHTVFDPTTNAPHHSAPISGLLKIEELSGFIAKASRPGSTLKDILIDIYDGHHQLTSHTRSSGKVTARSPFGQIVSTTQPKSIHNFLRKSDAESGFLNRWVLVSGPSRMEPKSYGDTPIDTSQAEDAYRDIVAWAITPHEYVLKDGAYDEWDHFFQTKLSDYKTGRRELDSIASRVDLTLKKVIILLTVNEKLPQPTAETVRRAVALYDYLRTVYDAFTQDIVFSEITECQDVIISTVQKFQNKQKRYPTRREIVNSLKKKFSTDIQVKAFRHLVELNMLEELPPEAGKTGMTRYRYAEA